MVNRTQRDAAGRVLRSLVDGVITNDEFEAQFPRGKEDSALPAIKANVWMLYSDLHRHKLTGKHEPNAETRALLERCVLFLDTDLAFEWPVPQVSLSNIGKNLRSRVGRWLGMEEEGRQAGAKQDGLDGGDEDVWPFFREEDLAKASVRSHSVS
jgi:hypothetical protein